MLNLGTRLSFNHLKNKARGTHIIVYLIIMLLGHCVKEQKTTVTFWHVMGGPIGKHLDEMITDFNKLHPEGEVKSVQMGSYDALAQKLMGAVASNSVPVIAQMYESWTDQFYKAGYLLPLGELIETDSQFHLSDLYPVFVEDNTFDSVLVTLPFNKSLPVFYYNADILKTVGFDSFPENWTGYRDLCSKLKATNVWPTSWPIDVWYFSAMLYQEGGKLYDIQQKKPMFNSAEGVQVLEYLVGLVKDSLFYLNPGFQRQDEFLSGNVATIPASIVSWVFMKDRPAFRMGVAPFPTGRIKSVVIAGTNIGMFKKTSTEQKKLAWEFIRWFLLPENQLRWTKSSYYLPVRKSTTQLPGFQEFLKENAGYHEIVAQLDFAQTEPRTREWFTGRIYLNEALEEALRLERTPEDALNNAAKRMLIERE